ncbi:hypothetical protein [Mucilaginibacter phyllosphaerae]
MLKPLIILLAAILFMSQLGCQSGKVYKQKSIASEFEGVITCHEIVTGIDSLYNLDDTVQIFYSHGNYVGIHSSLSQKIHLVKDYYFEDKPLRLLLFSDSDTLRNLNLYSPIERLDAFKVRKVNDKILSRECETIEVNTSYAEKDSITYTDFSFVFSRNYLTIDKSHFKNWHLGFFNKVTDESGAFYLKLKAVHFDSTHKNILSSKTYDVISVKEETIDPKVFRINSALIKY